MRKRKKRRVLPRQTFKLLLPFATLSRRVGRASSSSSESLIIYCCEEWQEKKEKEEDTQETKGGKVEQKKKEGLPALTKTLLRGLVILTCSKHENFRSSTVEKI